MVIGCCSGTNMQCSSACSLYLAAYAEGKGWQVCQRQRVPDLRLRLQLMCTYPLAGTKPKTSRDLGGSEGWVTGSTAECTVGLPGRSELMEFEAKLCAWKRLCCLVLFGLDTALPEAQLQGRSSQERNAALSL